MLWNKPLGWDDTVADENVKFWELINLHDLEQIADSRIQRGVTTGENTSDVNY